MCREYVDAILLHATPFSLLSGQYKKDTRRGKYLSRVVEVREEQVHRGAEMYKKSKTKNVDQHKNAT